MANFSYYNIETKKPAAGRGIVVTGEIHNETSKDYHTAVFKLVIFSGQESIASSVVKVQGFRSRGTKTFEVLIEELDFGLVNRITKCDLMFESVY
ncbi:MAG TPA: hypothetical protein P5110_00250 [Candidatus Omnitrophota bacterium]|nr:hypothetical protein [Candidatus Omnitrophota bacterium]